MFPRARQWADSIFKSHFNIIFLSKSGLPKWSPPLRLPDYNYVRVSYPVLHYAHATYHAPRFDHANRSL
jgi:hypothetical protein